MHEYGSKSHRQGRKVPYENSERLESTSDHIFPILQSSSSGRRLAPRDLQEGQ